MDTFSFFTKKNLKKPKISRFWPKNLKFDLRPVYKHFQKILKFFQNFNFTLFFKNYRVRPAKFETNFASRDQNLGGMGIISRKIKKYFGTKRQI